MQYVVSLLFASLCYFLITGLVFNILFGFGFSSFVCLFYILCILRFGIVLCIVSPFVCIFAEAYRPLPSGRIQTAVNKSIMSYYLKRTHVVNKTSPMTE